jgi:predicted transcriptional regulator
MVERIEMEKILGVLRPYAANWSGSLGRGDLVIPQREIPHLIQEILTAIEDAGQEGREVTDAELFHALKGLKKSPSLQDQAVGLRKSFRILKR